ncbi:hypothetical protein IIB34_02225 [PVC group bacterium]|nr:hypothetical protein [PVC group bacterium]
MGFTDVLRQFIERALFSQAISSANPTHTNVTRSVDINPEDFDGLIREEIQKTVGGKTTGGVAQSAKDTKDQREQLKGLLDGNVGDLNNFTSKQFGNVKAMSMNPIGWISMVFAGKLAKVASVIGLTLIIMEIVKFIIDESMKPGRGLDRRFKRLASEEIMLFMTHQEQEKLRRGFRDVRVTTNPGLSGGMGMVSGNLFQHQAVSGTLGGPTEYYYDTKVSLTKYTSSFATDANGNPRGGHRLR